jgi:hypothetical protein
MCIVMLGFNCISAYQRNLEKIIRSYFLMKWKVRATLFTTLLDLQFSERNSVTWKFSNQASTLLFWNIFKLNYLMQKTLGQIRFLRIWNDQNYSSFQTCLFFNSIPENFNMTDKVELIDKHRSLARH